MELIERFINYVKIDTQSDPNSHVTPSSAKQFNLANVLLEELKGLGIEDAFVDENCIVYGHLKSNCGSNVKLGFNAHMDTSDAMSGANVKPRIIKNYDGKDIVLNEELNIVMKVEDFPDLIKDKGSDLIVTDGTTLLGADDKAGVAEIMNMLQYLHDHPEVKHHNISIAFTPDEEIGEGADHFNLETFDADYAYTVDGGEVNSVDYECFNATTAIVKVHGVSIHPGSAKDKMINALQVAMEFNALLPEKERPEHTEGYEGFNHLNDMSGDVENAEMLYIIRNHDKKILERQKEDFRKAAKTINDKYHKDIIGLELTDAYENMAEIIKDHMYIVDNAKKVLKELGLEPVSTPIRGGTDGARLTYMGLPTPNLGTGGRNFHGKYEYANIQEMELAAKLVIELVKA
ncbi:MAG: peptidase T [Erysipelotrichaceae bacterium]|nr:peptidase T [Erysipelotrichaceae bacterium]